MPLPTLTPNFFTIVIAHVTLVVYRPLVVLYQPPQPLLKEGSSQPVPGRSGLGGGRRGSVVLPPCLLDPRPPAPRARPPALKAVKQAAAKLLYTTTTTIGVLTKFHAL